MDLLIEEYSWVKSYLDDTGDFRNTATLVRHGNKQFLIVAQTSDHRGGELLFEIGQDEPKFVAADTVVSTTMAPPERTSQCEPLDRDDHELICRVMKKHADRFSTSDGPDHGNLACVWALRHVVYFELGQWLTKTNGVDTLLEELKGCLGAPRQQPEPGFIVVSATRRLQNDKVRHGHIGLISDDLKSIYSNSSRLSRWEQNYDLDGWREHFGGDVLFYPVPNRSL